MTADPRRERFEELDAGRALGDLDAAESAEWLELAEEFGADPQLDALAAEIEIALGGKSATAMPDSLATKLAAGAPVVRIPAREPRKIPIAPWLGWAAAACLLGALILSKTPGEPSADKPLAELLRQDPALIRLNFGGVGETYEAAAGEVVWSDARQQGYMTLSQLPANDPDKNQYQLWIVDPQRDEFPVDGGVFDIPAGPGPVTIPIDAKLRVSEPAAFVITLEQPGGVVRSKQEVVVALAKS